MVLWASRWVHILAAMLAIGGAAFMRFALLPGAEQTLDNEAHQRLREAVRSRWARLVHASIALLLLTGGINFVILAMPPKVNAIPYHPVFGIKLLMALAVFFLATALIGRSPGFAALRNRMVPEQIRLPGNHRSSHPPSQRGNPPA